MIKHILFALALLAQVGILTVTPVEKMAIRSSGTVVTLRTRPVDPYDVMRGYYVTLSYEISEPPGFDTRKAATGDTVYVLLRRDADGVWNAEKALTTLPAELGADVAVIKGRASENRWRDPILFGIEKYFVPEEMREEIEAAVAAGNDQRIAVEGAAAAGSGQRILVDAAVDRDGDAALLRLRVGDTVYEY